MSIYAIGDLHLPGHEQKPMNVFGSQWDRHFEIICENWLASVGPGDVVLIPGDISWAMQLEQALDDLKAIANLPGEKVLLRGNHDYWWSSVSRVRAALGPGMHAIQNDAVELAGEVFCGTRGWLLPTPQLALSPQDEKIYRRELGRLKMSLDSAISLSGGRPFTVMTHFPPLAGDGLATEATVLMERYPVRRVVYGHLHGAGIKNGFTGFKNGIEYFLVSCDALDFSPLCIEKSGTENLNIL